MIAGNHRIVNPVTGAASAGFLENTEAGDDSMNMRAESGAAAEKPDNVKWGVTAQTGVLTDVLLGRPDHFRWVPLNSISAVTFANMDKMGHRFDQQKAMRQHREMVDVYEKNGV